ncbi:MAG: alanine racemase [Nitrospiraceae bacterium]
MPRANSFASIIATIDLQALTHNVAELRRHLSQACGILAVVKANAYGHGDVEITRTLHRLGISRFGVATLDEGLALRAAGIKAPILVMGALFPEQIPDLVAHHLIPVIYDEDIARRLGEHLRSNSSPYPVHIKVDTGMGRLGLSPEGALSLITSSLFKSRFRPEGLMTHLADADGDDAAFTERQLDRFRSVVTQAEQNGISLPLVHAANSAAILRYPASHFSLVRPGIMLYGYHTLPARGSLPALRPVLTLSATVAQVRTIRKGDSISYNRTFTAARESRIAILPVGYADGYSRSLSNRGAVLIAGQRAPIVGKVCMDMTMVDVTHVTQVKAGDQVVLIGQQGGERITADEVAEWLGTISYEVLCGIGPRVARVYC